MNPFRSPWWAGYECSDKLNAFGNRVDLLTATGHIQHALDDYKNLSSINIKTVREGIRWSQVEKQPYKYDWSVVRQMMRAAKAAGIQQVWDICHFGFADDLTPLHPMFARRFAALCKAFVHFFRSENPFDTIIVTPVNEVSFLSWLGGEVKGTSPYCKGYGWDVKYSLMRAYIEGVAAMREADPTVRILTTEPLVSFVPPHSATDEQIADAWTMHENQYQATDILCGKTCPELGGRPEYLDIVGLNYYYNNQWEHGTNDVLCWKNKTADPRWRPLRSLLSEAYSRYQRPLALTETSHCGLDKPDWISAIARECCAVMQENIPFWGICLYPIIDRPDWDHLHQWHDAGIWGVNSESASLERILHQPSANALRDAQLLMDQTLDRRPLQQVIARQAICL